MKRRTYTPEFKARVALAAMKNQQTISEIASEHGVHPIQISKWKKIAQEGLKQVFVDGRSRELQSHEEEKKMLYEEIGKLKVQLDWIKKKCGTELR